VRKTFAALGERDFRIWMAADLVSITGTWMQALAINWYVLQLTGSAARMGFALLLQALPVLLLSSWSGALADRLPGRPVLICTQLAHAALAAGLAVTAWGHLGGVSTLYVISALGGVVTAIEGPVMGRFASTIVDQSRLGNALSLGSLANSAGRILGMSLGGAVAAVVGPAPLFAGNAMSFLAVIGALLAVRGRRVARPEKRSGQHGVRAGWAYLLRQPAVLVTLALSVVLGSLGRNYQVTMAAMSDGPLHAGAAGYGMLSTVFAVGTVVGALGAARRGHLGYRLLIGAGLATSALQLLSGFSGGVWAFAAAILPIAAGAVLIDTTVAARVQLDTSLEMRGRVVAAMSMTSSLAGALGAPALGWLCEAAGARQALVLAGTVTVLASALAGLALAKHPQIHAQVMRSERARHLGDTLARSTPIYGEATAGDAVLGRRVGLGVRDRLGHAGLRTLERQFGYGARRPRRLAAVNRCADGRSAGELHGAGAGRVLGRDRPRVGRRLGACGRPVHH
jgi:MFS family permease